MCTDQRCLCSLPTDQRFYFHGKVDSLHAIVPERAGPGHRRMGTRSLRTLSRDPMRAPLLVDVVDPHVDARTASVECRAPKGSDDSFFVEADGEVLGSLPARFEVVPLSLTLLVPANAQP